MHAKDVAAAASVFGASILACVVWRSSRRRALGHELTQRGGALNETEQTWGGPSPVDCVREINSHAGRQATLLGFTIALTSLLGVGPLKPAVEAWNVDAYALVYFLLGVMGVSTWYAASNLYMALEPAIPDPVDNRESWERLFVIKRRHTKYVSLAIVIAVLADVFATTWMIGSITSVAFVVFLPVPLVLALQSAFQLWERRRFRRQFMREHPSASPQDESIAWLNNQLEHQYGIRVGDRALLASSLGSENAVVLGTFRAVTLLKTRVFD